MAPVTGTSAAAVSASREKSEIESAARAFEQILVQSLIQSMRQTLPSENGGIFGSSAGAGVYEGFFDQGMAEAIAPKLGLGLKDALLRQLTPGDASPSVSAALSASPVTADRSDTVQTTVAPQVPHGNAELSRRSVHESSWRTER